MKQLIIILVAFLMALTIIACDSDDEEKTNGGSNNTEVSNLVEMKISVLLDADKQDGPSPRLVAEWGDNMFAQVVDPSHPKVTMFQYINSNKGDDIVAIVSEHNIIFMNYNPTSGKDFPSDVLITSDDDNFSSLSSCVVNWENEEISFKKTIPLTENSKIKTKVVTKGENDLLKKPFFDMFDEMSEKISNIKDKMAVFGALGRSATLLCDIWTEGLIPVMKYQLYDDDKIAQQQYVQEHFTGKATDWVKDRINGKVDDGKDKMIDYLCKVTSVERKDVNLCLWMYDNLYRPKVTTIDKPTNEKEKLVNLSLQATSNLCEKIGASYTVINETQDVPDEDAPEWWNEEDEYDNDDEFDDEYDNNEEDEEDGDEYNNTEWSGTTWTFTGNATLFDSEDGTSSGAITFTIDFLESGEVHILGTAVGETEDFNDGSVNINIEYITNGVIITNRGSDTDTDSYSSQTNTWSFTWTLHKTDATHATMEWDGQDNYSGWWDESRYDANGHKTGTIRHNYSGSTTYTGQFTGTCVM